jgi:uncharacterized membrane protein
MDLCRQGYAVIFGVLTFFYGAIFLALIELLGICMLSLLVELFWLFVSSL